MFYRRKILLALLELFGGTLSVIDCHALLFLFCLRSEKQYYDFFPHTFGPFSLFLQQDKKRLTEANLLTVHTDFQLCGDVSYFQLLEAKDREALQIFVAEFGEMRGKELLRTVYLTAPSIASRSRIIAQVLAQEELEYGRFQGNGAQTPCLFTLGYEGLSIDAYLEILITNHVVALVDVRKNPFSMKYGFSKSQFANAMKIAGITYIHLPDLGIPSQLRKDLGSETAYRKLFEYYFVHMLPEHREAIEQLKTIIGDYKRVVLTCFEAKHTSCHRHKIVEYLEAEHWLTVPVSHLGKSTSPVTCIPQEKFVGFQTRLWEEDTLYSSVESISL